LARQRFSVGDALEVPVGDGCGPSLGQVIDIIPEALNAVGCAFWVERNGNAARQVKSPPISVLLVTPDLLKNKTWQVVGNAAASIPIGARPYERFRTARWVGAKVIGSATVREFLQACRGLADWDDWADPRYLDSLLFPGTPIPIEARYNRGTTSDSSRR